MIHFVLHDARDSVAVVVVEGVSAGTLMTGWVMDDDETVRIEARQEIGRASCRERVCVPV